MGRGTSWCGHASTEHARPRCGPERIPTERAQSVRCAAQPVALPGLGRVEWLRTPLAPSFADPTAATTWSRTQRLALGALLVLATVLAYGPIFGATFVYDDTLVVLRNPAVSEFDFGALLSRPLWSFYSPESELAVGYWRPAASLLLATTYAFAGPSPLAFHLLVLVLHVAASCAAWSLARRITHSDGIGFAVGLLFALHPVHVESVAWISAIGDPAFGLCVLLALERHLAWREAGSNGSPWVAGALILAGLAAKELAAGGIVAIIAVDWALKYRGGIARATSQTSGEPHIAASRDVGDPLGANSRSVGDPHSANARNLDEPERAAAPNVEVPPVAMPRNAGESLDAAPRDPTRASTARARAWRAYAPYAAAFALYVVARMAVFQSPFAGFDRTTTEFGVSVSRLLLLRAEILGLALRFSAWPTDLRLFHPFAPNASQAGLALPLALLAAWTVLTAWLYSRGERVLFAASLLILAPISLLVVRVGSLGTFPFSERYLYVAVFGVVLLAALVVRRFLPTVVGAIVLAATAITAGIATHAQARMWTDDATLFETAAQRSPRAPYARWLLGRDLLERYRATNDIEALRRAEREFQEALALLTAAQHGDGSILGLSDDHVQSNVGLGWVLLYLADADGTRDFKPSESIFAMLTERYKKSEEAWVGLGVARMELGELALAQEAFERAIAVNERFVEAHRNLGRLHTRNGDWTAARAAFETALRWKPDDVDTMLLLGGVMERLGDDAAARSWFDGAAKLAPNDSRPRVQRANLVAKSGRLDEALVEVDAALTLNAADVEAHVTRGKVLAALGERNGALASFERACDLDPKSYEAHRNAGALALQLGDAPRAVAFLLRAYDSRPRTDSGAEIQRTIRSLPVANAQAFLQLATTDADRSDFASALAWLDDLFVLEPENGPALFLRGAMLRKQGDTVGARAAWERALPKMPDSFPLLESLGTLLYELGEREEALKHLEKALQLLEKAAQGSPEFDQPLDLLRGRVEGLRQRR